MRSIINELGSDLESLFYLTDIVKCWSGNSSSNRKPKDNEINNCRIFLQNEISQLQPYLILAFGKTAAKALLGRSITLKHEHGKITEKNNLKILVLFHPSNINLQMDVNLYRTQLKILFDSLIHNNLENIESVFYNKE